MNIHPEIQKFYGTEDNSFFYGNSLDVAGYLALGSKKANGNDKEIEGGGGGELEVLRKSGEYLKQSPWGLAWETLVMELMGDVGNQCEHDHVSGLYCYFIFFSSLR